MPVYKTNSEEETVVLGETLSRELPQGGVVLLTGNLGAGKTTLTKGIAKARGAASPEEVSSPTFTLIHEYGDPPSVYHVDLYRLEEEKELATLGLEELYDRNALVLIEWGERFAAHMPTPRHEIRIERLSDTGRLIELVRVTG